MKHNKTLYISIAFFLIINTKYCWEGYLGFLDIPVLLLLIAVFGLLCIFFIKEVYILIKEKFKSKSKIISTSIIALILITTILKPFGLIDFDKLAGENILIAEGEGAASCKTELKLKANFTFKQRTVCFGISEIKGDYQIVKDTIFFYNVKSLGVDDTFYKFAIIRKDTAVNSNYEYLYRFKSLNDKYGVPIYIKQNNISKVKK